MIEWLPYFSAIFVGVIMGLIGGGGSILCVPIFVYIFKMGALEATAASLFVVGITSLLGSFSFIARRLVHFRMAVLFGIPSLFSIYFVRKMILPFIPQKIPIWQNHSIEKNTFLLLLFSFLMILSSYKMIFSKMEQIESPINNNFVLLISQGIAVGFISGMVGAGGGFLIVPALVMLVNMEIKKAIGTSLLIISINSLIGFLGSYDSIPTNWNFIILFSSLSILGLAVGILISKKIRSTTLKPIFGILVLVMGIFIIIKEFFL